MHVRYGLRCFVGYLLIIVLVAAVVGTYVWQHSRIVRRFPGVPARRPRSARSHPAWDTGSGWKHHLNNLRLLLQPYVCSCLLLPWLALVPLPHVPAVQTGLAALARRSRSSRR